MTPERILIEKIDIYLVLRIFCRQLVFEKILRLGLFQTPSIRDLMESKLEISPELISKSKKRT